MLKVKPPVLDTQREFLLLELVSKNLLRKSMLAHLLERNTMTYAELKERFPYPRHLPMDKLIRYGFVRMDAESRIAIDKERILSIPEVIYRYKRDTFSAMYRRGG